LQIPPPRLRSGSAFAGLRIGLLGGSFNPAHAGHRAISLYALKRLGLDQIWWLVSPQNPLKPIKGMAPLGERTKVAQKTAQHPRIAVTVLESEFGTRYTVDTLKILKHRFPRTRFVWLMGADNLRQVTRWRHWQELFELVPVAVFRRPTYAAGSKRGKAATRFSRGWLPASESRNLANLKPPAWLVMDNPLNSFSATEIRKDRPTWPKQKRP
jgi:nicotinate-nucleotide adenylyltransferase